MGGTKREQPLVTSRELWHEWGFRTVPGRKGPAVESLSMEAAFFDLDKTIIATSSTLAFGRPLYRAGLLTRRGLLKAGIAQISYRMFGADHDQMERARAEMTAIIKGWNQDQLRDIARETVDEVVTPKVFAEALAIIDDHLQAGRRVVIVSSSGEEIVEPLASHLRADAVIATRAAVDELGYYTGEIEFYAYGDGKAEAIRQFAERESISLADSFAYSDSHTDLPMLETVGHPVAVNPDKELARVAEERGWEVLHFDRPVTIRTRLASLPRPTPVVSGAALAGAIGGVALYWALRTRRA
jgi:HAD superfamily hydrolase (TIGR01490 family)